MMTSSIEQQKDRVRTLLTEVISLFCKNTLMFDSELCIEGLIGITKDKTDLMLISIKDIISSTVLPGHDMSGVMSGDEYVDRPSNSHDCRVDDSVVVVKHEHTHPVEVISVDDDDYGDLSVPRHEHKRHVARCHAMGYTGDVKKLCVGGRNGDVAVTCIEPAELRNPTTNVHSDLSDLSGFPYVSPLHLTSREQMAPTFGSVDSNRTPELATQKPGTEMKFDTPLCDVSAKYQCEICLRGFGVRQALDDHMQGVHLGTPRFFCPHCGKRFRFRSSLSYHKRKCVHNSQRVQSDTNLGWIYVSSSDPVATPGSSIQSETPVALPSNELSQLPVFPTANVMQQQLQEQLGHREQAQERLLQQLCSTAAEQQCQEREKNGTAADAATKISDVT